MILANQQRNYEMSFSDICSQFKKTLQSPKWITEENSDMIYFYRMTKPELEGRVPPICSDLV